MKRKLYYLKVLHSGRMPVHYAAKKNGAWPPVGEWTFPVMQRLRVCSVGYHVYSARAMLRALSSFADSQDGMLYLYLCDVRGKPSVDGRGKLAFRKARLVKELVVLKRHEVIAIRERIRNSKNRRRDITSLLSGWGVKVVEVES